jgi:uncharacterized protein
MTKQAFELIEAHMLSHMRDSAHDRHHISRVLYAALDIAAGESHVDHDVLIAACLLHDIGREKQAADPSVCHAQAGGEMAYYFLMSIGWDQSRALHVKACITSHRYRGDNPPDSIEARILFDADKLDACGAMGIARTLIYSGQTDEPLYRLDDDGRIITGSRDMESESFFEEYEYKLKKVYESFYTEGAARIASQQRQAAADFRDALYRQIDDNMRVGRECLRDMLAK